MENNEKLLRVLEKNYKLERQIGSGGMGIVFLATDKRLERKVAIKVLKLSENNQDSGVTQDEVLERFLREARAVAKLSHPNIVNIFDIGNEEDVYYMVMEYVDGFVLSDIVNERDKLDYKAIVNIIMQVCTALDFAHENGIIHRDIKPANIIVSKKGIAKLMDFGIATLNNTKESYKLTQAGSILGSIMYISPEQLNDSSNVTPQSDIYSLGITLYELLTGELPFMSDSISQIVLRILSEMPDRPSKLNNNIPEELDEVIFKSLSKNISQRYSNAMSFANDLRKFAGDFDNNIIIPNSSNNNNNTILISSVKPERVSNSTVLVNNSKLSDTLTNLMDTDVRKTILNEPLIKSLENDLSWIKNLIYDWEIKKPKSKIIEDILEENFSGIILINNDIFIFVYNGFTIGAINSNNKLQGQDIFDNLPNEYELSLYISPKEKNYLPLVISTLFNYETPIDLNVDSLKIDVKPLIDSLSSEETPFTGIVKCYIETNIIYYGYYQGNQVFNVLSDIEDDILEENYKDINSLILFSGTLINTYPVKIDIMGSNLINIMKNTEINLNYKNDKDKKLIDISDVGNEEAPNFLIKQVRNNTYLEINNTIEKIKIFDTEIETLKVIKESIYYKFANWLIDEYFYKINSTLNTISFKPIYSLIPYINKFVFYKKLDNDINKFPILVKGKIKNEEKNLFLVQIGKGNIEDTNKFLDNIIDLKNTYLKSIDISGAFYISMNSYENYSLKEFLEKTQENKKGLFNLDSTHKYKGFIKLGYNKGVQVHFLEYTNEEFELIEPKLL